MRRFVPPLRSPPQARLLPVIAGAAAVLLVAGAAAAHTQASADPPGLFGMIAALLGCNEAFEAALMARDALDEAEFHALLDATTGPGP
ncbi:hypothetical protein [Roseicella aquatilis]|uniref:hypothetical protein n=1 Tax=Roseicella aquatilis TaxID=2527868 RepID=UPI0014051F84|nr:hypothetical protein [Roseicella aquatilis]